MTTADKFVAFIVITFFLSACAVSVHAALSRCADNQCNGKIVGYIDGEDCHGRVTRSYITLWQDYD